ncbi:MAG: serine hydroxymethyltransferase [Patescibacteria group bacterium]
MKDDVVRKLIRAEEKRQAEGLELIPSENYVSSDVKNALASVFTNKYSEGYPGSRYYGGQEFTDQVEQLAIDRAKQLFRCDHANVQPHSGAQANEAAYHAWLEPGDTVLAMALDQGGHLTHGHPVTVLARQFNFIRYGMRDVETGEIDYDELLALAKKHHPKIILAGFSSYPRELNYAKFAEIAKDCGAVLMADVAHIAGLIAADVLSNPFDYGFQIVTSTTHKTLRGPRGGLILSRGTVSSSLKAPKKTVDHLPTLIDRAVFPGIQGGPHMNVIAAKAVAFDEASRPEFKTYATQIVKNAKTLADELMKVGCKLITNGTDNHMMLIDVVQSFGVDGGEAELALDSIGLNANKNIIPFDERPAFRPSGLRLGTPAITTRGLKEKHMNQLARWIVAAIKSKGDQVKLGAIKKEVTELSLQFPLP